MKLLPHYRKKSSTIGSWGKYKRANKVVKLLAGVANCLGAVGSSASLGTALSVIGIPAAVPSKLGFSRQNKTEQNKILKQ